MLWAFLRIFRRGTHRGAGSESLPTETPNTLAQTNPVIEICSCNNGADHTFLLANFTEIAASDNVFSVRHIWVFDAQLLALVDIGGSHCRWWSG